MGLGPASRVALLATNGAAYAQAVHGVTRLGAALLPVNARLTPHEALWQLQHAGVVALVYDGANAATAAAIHERAPRIALASLSEVAAAPEGGGWDAAWPGRVGLDALHTIIYTSGTTGRPKGVMLTHGNHLWSALGSALNLGLREDDRLLACMPLFHAGGLAILMRSVVYGIPAIVHATFDPAAVSRDIDEEGVTIVSVVATMLQRLLDERGARPYPPGFRLALVGGGPVPRPLLEACAGRGVPVVQTYGLTEAASQVATLAPEDALRKLGSAGKPLFPTELRIEDGGVAAAPGQRGEIVVRGPTVTPGYLDDAVATARAIRDGWLYTGDYGYLDEAGYLYMVDRREDLIVTGGENVAPAEVEEALRAHAAIIDAGVVGVPDPRWGQAVAATVVLRPGAIAPGGGAAGVPARAAGAVQAAEAAAVRRGAAPQRLRQAAAARPP